MRLNLAFPALPDWRAPGVADPLWRSALARLGGVWAVLILVFASDWAAMARQWWDISTYNHILLIPPILAALVWQRAAELAKLQPEMWWPALIGAAGAVFLWVLGAFSGLDLARQLAAVLMLVTSVPLLLGPRVTAGLAFPLAYMTMLVPFGDELVPALQMVTAAITVALVHLIGVPAEIDGVFIDTPAGLFEVAEACSGVQFLIAMVAFGLLLANTCFSSWRRRVAVFALCLVVPILANGVRAFGTIWIAQVFGMEFAAGVDHIVYGWVFFAIVLAIVIAVAWRFFDRPLDEPPIDGDRLAGAAWLDRPETMRIAPWRALGLGAVIVLSGHGWVAAAERAQATLPDGIDLPQVSGWHRVDYAPTVWWEPRATGADHRLLGRYVDAQGREVDVFYALYSRQKDGAEAGGYGQGALDPDTGWAWLSPGPEVPSGKSERLVTASDVKRLAVTRYRSGDVLTGSNARLKLATMADRITLRARPTAVLILSTEERSGEKAHETIAVFERSAGPIDVWMDRLAGLR